MDDGWRTVAEGRRAIALGTSRVEWRDQAPHCHSERSEESRPSAPKYHLSSRTFLPEEKWNIPMRDEILRYAQNDRGQQGAAVLLRHSR